jgi:hypothetical protein
MPIYTGKDLEKLYEKQLTKAIKYLKELDIYSGNDFIITGLNGWVYEQMIQYCLKKELKKKGLQHLLFEEQISIQGRMKIDLVIKNVAIEIKSQGLFSDDQIKTYRNYKKILSKKGYSYLYLSQYERVEKFITGPIKVFGKKNVFFLDNSGGWKKFVNRVYSLLNEKNSVKEKK